jgi:hypothetical protein
VVLDVTAKTKDGREVFRDTKIYMPQSSNSRGDAMVYGAHFKMGLISDTSLQPLQTKTETFEIPFPFEDVEKEKGKPKARVIKEKELDVRVELRYQLDPAPGVIGRDSFVFYTTTKTVGIK